MASIQQQIAFYNQLLEGEKYIINAIAIKGEFSNMGEITDILMYRIKITQKTVKEVLIKAIAQGIVTTPEVSYSYGSHKYKINTPFMVFVYTQIEGYENEWKQDQPSHKYNSIFFLRGLNNLTIVKQFLYELLYENKLEDNVQNTLLDRPTILEDLDILTYPNYLKCLHKLDIKLLNAIYLINVNKAIYNFTPIEKVKEIKERILQHINPSILSELNSMDDAIRFYSGEFDTIVKLETSKQLVVILAIRQLLAGETEAALKLFDIQLKALRLHRKDIQSFSMFEHNYFYCVALLCINPDEATLRAQKILNSYNKAPNSDHDKFFKALLYSILNKKQERDALQSIFFARILTTPDLVSLFLIPLAYLAELQPPVNARKEILALIKKGYDVGSYTFAYEAAYAADKWFGLPETAEIYTQIASKMTYQPACSLIKRQEEWEKSLSLIFSAVGGSKSTKGVAKSTENSSRVVYLINPKNAYIQPILQSRNAKGDWSSGRNIALKTFYAGKTQGMTEQDYRVSKSIKYHKGGYYESEYYELTPKTLVELIGHPYLFLYGANEVQIEFVAAQPVITVSKRPNGYVLSSDIKDLTTGTFMAKETNTRYKVYDLNSHQMNLLQVLTQQNVVVPEHGKQKLIQLLGEISKYATVHSDLLSSQEQSNLKIKVLESDNRIRVQLLPFGDGLKAELFAKPFGDFPPYCKPGMGGKVLITNDKGFQLQVKRDLKIETQLANEILNDIEQLESVNMNDDLIAFEEPLDSLHLLDVLSKHQDKCVVEWPEGVRYKISGTASFANLKLQIKSKNNWFALDGELKVDEDTVISLQQLMTLFAKGHDRFVELKNGEFLALSAELKKRLQELYTFSTSEKNGLNINKFASVALGDFFDDVEDLKTDKAWKEFRSKIENQSNTEAEIPAALQAELRPYQEEGFRWMARLADWEGGACLADDMGLGKTVQTLAVLLHRSTKGAALVVCPVSVVGNWIAEAQRFAPSLNVKLLGNNNRQQSLDELEAGDVLITSYGLLQSEEKLFIEKDFATVVLDEAHIIKNYATKTSKATMQLKAGFRLALTGTPLQNHQGEIWNLFNFINPGLLGNLNHFTDTFIKPDNDYAHKLLKKLIKPFILRRTKSAVLDELPPKTEIIKKIQLSAAEMAFYEALRRQAIQNIEANDDNQLKKQFQVLAEITKLRQASCNPQLVDSTIDIESSKLATFIEIVDELIENNHRALVFSQFVSHLAIVRKALDKKGISYQYLDGSTPMAERERNVKKFQSGDGQLFLISLKAGGLGLNLTAADYVIHLDPWWNPAIEDQASDRAHRIGQKRPVTIYRLVAENTIEEKIIKLHNTKRNLAETLLEGSDQSAKMSFKELVLLIQEGI